MSGSDAHSAERPAVRVEGDLREVGRIFCIGRNYAEHVREMGNRDPVDPVIFLKPATCLVPPGVEIPFPLHGEELHHEAEIVLLLRERGEGWDRVAGVGLGLDLTLRDVQRLAREQGLPWETAKAFDASAPVGEMVAPGRLADRDRIRFECRVGDDLRQRGDSADMILDVPGQLRAIARVWALRPGDLVFTGSPAGVGPLLPGDHVTVAGEGLGEWSWRIVAPKV